MTDSWLSPMVPVPGTDVDAWVVKSRHAPGWWSYTLFNSGGGVIASDAIELPNDVTQEQVARIAFLLEVDYAGAQGAGRGGRVEQARRAESPGRAV